MVFLYSGSCVNEAPYEAEEGWQHVVSNSQCFQLMPDAQYMTNFHYI